MGLFTLLPESPTDVANHLQMQGAQRFVMFASHVQIMPMEGVSTATIEPIASLPDSPASDSALIVDPVPLTDHNSPLASCSGNSDSEVNDTNWTDDIGAEPPHRRMRTVRAQSLCYLTWD